MIDRSLTALLAMLDRVGVALAKEHIKGHKLRDVIYAGKVPTLWSGWDRIRKCALVEDEDGPRLVLFSFGWSRHEGKICHSYNNDWTDGPHALANLKSYNPDDPRIKGPERGDMEALAWVVTEQEAYDDWEARWRDVMGYDQELIEAFYRHTQRSRQLYFRRSFVLRQIAKVVRSHLHVRGKDLYQTRDRIEHGGPAVTIDGREFWFDQGDLREGKPFPVHEFEGEATLHPDSAPEEWGYDGRHGAKTRELRRHLNDRQRKRENRAQRRKAQQRG